MWQSSPRKASRLAPSLPPQARSTAPACAGSPRWARRRGCRRAGAAAGPAGRRATPPPASRPPRTAPSGWGPAAAPPLRNSSQQAGLADAGGAGHHRRLGRPVVEAGRQHAGQPGQLAAAAHELGGLAQQLVAGLGDGGIALQEDAASPRARSGSANRSGPPPCRAGRMRPTGVSASSLTAPSIMLPTPTRVVGDADLARHDDDGPVGVVAPRGQRRLGRLGGQVDRLAHGGQADHEGAVGEAVHRRAEGGGDLGLQRRPARRPPPPARPPPRWRRCGWSRAAGGRPPGGPAITRQPIRFSDSVRLTLARRLRYSGRTSGSSSMLVERGQQLGAVAGPLVRDPWPAGGPPGRPSRRAPPARASSPRGPPRA